MAAEEGRGKKLKERIEECLDALDARSEIEPCPGREDCINLQMDSSSCEQCPSRADRGGAPPDRWVMHLIWLENLIAAGCSFGLDDLDNEEWRGLIMLKSARAKREAERIKKLADKGAQA